MAVSADAFMSIFRRTKMRPDAFYAKSADALFAQDVFDVSDLVELPAGVLREALDAAGTTLGVVLCIPKTSFP